MNSVFVMGADTSVGKTVVCAGLVKAGQGFGKIGYWKPIQTGTLVGDDAVEVRSLVGEGSDTVLESVYRFTDPMAPVLAAEKWGKQVELEPILQKFKQYVREGYTLVLEGTAGLLAPLGENFFQADLMKALNLPVLIIGEDRTGIVNQVLMTVECAQKWNLNLAGVVLLNSRASLGNAPAINRFGKGIKVILEVPPLTEKRSLVAHLAGSSELRQVLGVGQIPT